MFVRKKFSAKNIRRLQVFLICFILGGQLLLGDKFYLVPESFQPGRLAFLFGWLDKLKAVMVTSLDNSVPQPHASFIAGVILGARDQMPYPLVLAFRKTGTSHLVAVSGYNVTVFANSFTSLLMALGVSRNQSFWLILVALLNFAILTGGQAAVLRAVIMSAIFLIGRRLGRPAQISIAIYWAAILMMILNPSIYLTDLGFQLSFLSTLGLVYFSEFFSQRLPKIWPDFLKEGMSSTLSATLMTAPLLVYDFGRFSTVALPVNLLVLPAMPYLMFFGSITMFVGIFSPFLAGLPGLFSLCVSAYVIDLVNFFSRLPAAEVTLAKSIKAVLLIYGFLFVFYRLFVKKKRKPLSGRTGS